MRGITFFLADFCTKKDAVQPAFDFSDENLKNGNLGILPPESADDCVSKLITHRLPTISIAVDYTL